MGSGIVLVCLLMLFVSPSLCDADKRLLLNDPAVNADRINKLEQLVNQLNASLNALQSIVKETKPAFYAVIVKHPIKITNDAILKFEVVKVNSGNNYDPITGVFIAPIDGIYQFTSVVYNDGNSPATVQLNKNNELVVNGYTPGNTHANSHTMNAILRLVNGDHVYVQHRGGGSESIIGGQHSSFSGFYISE